MLNVSKRYFLKVKQIGFVVIAPSQRGDGSSIIFRRHPGGTGE